MQELPPNASLSKRSWVDFAGALQSAALTFLCFSFLRITCRKLLAIHSTVADASETSALSGASLVLLRAPLSIPLNLILAGVVIGALGLAYFRSCRKVIIVFGFINAVLAILWVAVALFIGAPMVLY